MHTDRQFDPHAGNVIAAAKDLGDALHRYIAVHDAIFKLSLRRVLPIPGFFKAIDFQQHFESLRFIQGELERVLEIIRRWEVQTEASRRLLAYGHALRNAVAQLAEICAGLFQNADGTAVYTSSQYKHDLATYNRCVDRYRELGIHVNALFGR